MQQRSLRSFRSLALALKIALVAGALYVVVAMYATGQVILGTVTLAVVALATYVFGARRAYAARYLFPGLFGVALFIVLPLVYTCLLYTSPSPRDRTRSRMPSSA